MPPATRGTTLRGRGSRRGSTNNTHPYSRTPAGSTQHSGPADTTTPLNNAPPATSQARKTSATGTAGSAPSTDSKWIRLDFCNRCQCCKTIQEWRQSCGEALTARADALIKRTTDRTDKLNQLLASRSKRTAKIVEELVRVYQEYAEGLKELIRENYYTPITMVPHDGTLRHEATSSPNTVAGGAQGHPAFAGNEAVAGDPAVWNTGPLAVSSAAPTFTRATGAPSQHLENTSLRSGRSQNDASTGGMGSNGQEIFFDPANISHTRAQDQNPGTSCSPLGYQNMALDWTATPGSPTSLPCNPYPDASATPQARTLYPHAANGQPWAYPSASTYPYAPAYYRSSSCPQTSAPSAISTQPYPTYDAGASTVCQVPTQQAGSATQSTSHRRAPAHTIATLHPQPTMHQRPITQSQAPTQPQRYTQPQSSAPWQASAQPQPSSQQQTSDLQRLPVESTSVRHPQALAQAGPTAYSQALAHASDALQPSGQNTASPHVQTQLQEQHARLPPSSSNGPDQTEPQVAYDHYATFTPLASGAYGHNEMGMLQQPYSDTQAGF